MSNCELCGKPMPEGEEMFKYHGYSGPCPVEPADTAEAKVLELAATDPEWRMDAYHYEFKGTGIALIDRILSAVACAGKAYHHTCDWRDMCPAYDDHLRGNSPQEWIENAAEDAAKELRAMLDASPEYRP